ncbi:MAG: helix-turn-helix transcriptional regulator [Deltaproteobacteria bacterium]|nr:helix-turn-helix transcriptional regulator [Deltaproteobacteria bacterium]
MTAIAIRRRVSANIKRCRQRAGLTQEAMASRLGVSLRYVSMLEQNARNLSIESLAKVAGCLEVDIAELVCDEKYLDQAKQSAAELGIQLLQQFVKGHDDT